MTQQNINRPPKAPPFSVWTPSHDHDICHILMIGNSFCMNYSDELYEMARTAGIRCRLTSLVVGACTLEMHGDYYAREIPAYTVITYDENGYRTEEGKTMQYALGLADWDVISYQDGERYYRLEGVESAMVHMEPHLTALVTAIRGRFPNAIHYFHQVWAYQVGYYRPEKSPFRVINSAAQAVMHRDLRDMAVDACERHSLYRIPTGDAWTIARADRRVGDDLCTGDKEHDSEQTGGQYLNACVWLETLFGKSCMGNYIDSPYLTRERMSALQEAAHQAVAYAYGEGYASQTILPAAPDSVHI